MDKDLKYDRQLRLWASTGQTNLEHSHICVINATTTGSEILKNLILPGIGKFTLVDHRDAAEVDLSSNFFLKRSDANLSLAYAVTRNLRELNPDVQGYAVTRKVADLESSFWDVFNVVIVSDYIPNLAGLIDTLWSKQIPVLVVNTIGMYGSINLISHEITVVETHDPSSLYDLRIDQPWDELREYVDSVQLDKLDTYEHAHVPYIVILIKALDMWKSTQRTPAPSSYKEKETFRRMIVSMSRDISIETNFAEALSAAHRAFHKTEVPHSILQLFENPKIDDVDGSNLFWVYLRALRSFIEKYHQLPLSGNLPDMASHTENYLRVKDLYRQKARSDRDLFSREVEAILTQLGRPKNVSDDSIATFCRNCRSLFVTQGTKRLHSERLANHMYGGEKNGLLAVYYAILTYNHFIDTYNRKPKVQDIHIFTSLFREFSGISVVPEEFTTAAKELLLHDTNSYHNLNSLMGGIGSQEVLKLTTGQYTPLDNLFVFDGVHSDSYKWKI